MDLYRNDSNFINLGEMDITVVSFPTHEHRTSQFVSFFSISINKAS